ncbi:hypothetical protein Tco_1363373 [Tanacetum coccineum]
MVVVGYSNMSCPSLLSYLLIVISHMIELCTASSATSLRSKDTADQGKKRPREPNASSSSPTLNHSSSSHPLVDPLMKLMTNLLIPILLLHLKTFIPHQIMSLESIKTLLVKDIT